MGYTYSEILQRIKDQFPNDSSRIEGTFSMDNAQAVSQELARIHHMEVSPLLNMAFLDTATGMYLDRRALDFNEVRRQATHSNGKLQFSSPQNVYIPTGTVAAVDGQFFETTEAGRVLDGSALVPARCTVPGSAGNVPANTIQTLVTSVPGVRSVNNPAAFGGGADQESDEEYRQRLLDKIRLPITSGNENHYVYWAKKAHTGVRNARCFGCWQGPGTVKVTILGQDGIPSDELMQAVEQYLLKQKTIGVDLTVAKAQPLPVNITGTVLLAPGYRLDEVKSGVRTAVAEYLSGVGFGDLTIFNANDTRYPTAYVSYHKIGDLIFNVDGVNDLRDLLVNGQTSSVAIEAEQFCTLGVVDLHAA